jgi:hypothetical protein
MWVGIGFTGSLLFVFLVGRTLVEGAATSTSNEFRIAITQILMTGYAASAYAYLLITARRFPHDLALVVRQGPEWQRIVDQVGKYPGWLLPLVGAASSLAFGVTATNVTTLEIEPWYWRNWSYDVYWHRATTFLFAWWMGCLFYTIVAESARLSSLSDAIQSLDLLELSPYRPFTRQGLTNALLVIGIVSVTSLLLVESRYGPMLVGGWISCVIFAWIVLMLPLRGMRNKIRIAKDQELDWCRQALRTARDELKTGIVVQQPIAELIAYRTIIENIRNWPFENPTLLRFALYVMIPLGSWFGGAFVERGLDFFLS